MLFITCDERDHRILNRDFKENAFITCNGIPFMQRGSLHKNALMFSLHFIENIEMLFF